MPRQMLIQVRRDSSSSWLAMNPVLAEGEVGYEIDTRRIKIGDGVTPWTALDYIAGVPGLHLGDGPPSAALGDVGHSYIDTASGTLYGPKTAAGWPAGVSIKGPKGDKGDAGPAALTATHTATLGLVQIGALWSATVTVPGATVGMVAVLNVLEGGLLSTVSGFTAAVTAANTVTISLKAIAVVAAGARTFHLRVIR